MLSFSYASQGWRALACATVAAGCLITAPLARADVIYDYQFSSNASVTTALGTDAISGTIDYDASNNTVTNPDVTIAGYNTLKYVFNSSLAGNVFDLWDGNGSCCDANGLVYFAVNAGDFSSDSVVPLSAMELYNTTQGNLFTFNVSGGLDPARVSNPVPEPATIVLFGTALVGIGVLRRRRKHA